MTIANIAIGGLAATVTGLIGFGVGHVRGRDTERQVQERIDREARRPRWIEQGRRREAIARGRAAHPAYFDAEPVRLHLVTPDPTGPHSVA